MMAKRAFAPKTIADPLPYHEQICKKMNKTCGRKICAMAEAFISISQPTSFWVQMSHLQLLMPLTNGVGEPFHPWSYRCCICCCSRNSDPVSRGIPASSPGLRGDHRELW